MDLTQLAHEIVQRLRETHPQRHVDVRIAEGLHARADARLLPNAIENLIGNSWKYTSKTTRPVIEVGAVTVSADAGVPSEGTAGTGTAGESAAGTGDTAGDGAAGDGAAGKGATFYFTLPDESAETLC